MTAWRALASIVLVAAAASGCSGCAPSKQAEPVPEIRYPQPQPVERPNLAIPTLAQTRLTVFPLSLAVPADSCKQVNPPGSPSSAPRAYVVEFRLNATADVAMNLRSRDGRPLATMSAPGHPGLNRVCLPGKFLSALEHAHAELGIVARGGGGESNRGSISIPRPSPGTGTIAGPAPGTDFRHLVNIQAGSIVAVAGYYAANDARHHAIVATTDGVNSKITEVFFTPDDPNSLGVGVAALGSFPGKIVGIAAYYAMNDDYQHVFVGEQAGAVFELYWNPSEPEYAFHVDVLRQRPGLASIAAFVAPQGGWNKWPQFVVTVANNVTTLSFLTSPGDPNQFDLNLNPHGENLWGNPAPTQTAFAAYYSSNQNALVILGVRRIIALPPGYILSLFLPLDAFAGNQIGGFYGGDFFEVGHTSTGLPSLAAFSAIPALSDEIIITESNAPGDVVEYFPDFQKTARDCGTRIDTTFFPGAQNMHPAISWCKYVRAHFDSDIIALAGYYSPPTAQNGGFQNVLVATANGDVNLLRFKPLPFR